MQQTTSVEDLRTPEGRPLGGTGWHGVTQEQTREQTREQTLALADATEHAQQTSDPEGEDRPGRVAQSVVALVA